MGDKFGDAIFPICARACGSWFFIGAEKKITGRRKPIPPIP